MDVMAAGNRRKAGSRSGQEDQLFMEYLIVPHVLYEGWRRQVGELRQVDRCALHASQRLCQHVVQIGGQLRQFAPKVFGNEPTTAGRRYRTYASILTGSVSQNKAVG